MAPHRAHDVAQRMDPVVDGRVDEPSFRVDVILPLRVDHRLTREIRGEQARHAVGRTGGVIEHVGGGMTFGEIKQPAGAQQRRDDIRPPRNVREPADGAPGDEHDVELVRRGDRPQCIVEVGANKARSAGKAQLVRQSARRLDGWGREIETDHFGATLRQLEAVRSEMALQVDDALAIDRGKLCLLNPVQPAASGTEDGQVVSTRTDMDPDALVPVRAIGAVPLGVGHGDASALVLLNQETSWRSRAGGDRFVNTASNPRRNRRFRAPFCCSVSRASASAAPSASTNSSTRWIAPSAGPGITVPKKFSNG